MYEETLARPFPKTALFATLTLRFRHNLPLSQRFKDDTIGEMSGGAPGDHSFTSGDTGRGSGVLANTAAST